jgi:hypothetical protein
MPDDGEDEQNDEQHHADEQQGMSPLSFQRRMFVIIYTRKPPGSRFSSI